MLFKIASIYIVWYSKKLVKGNSVKNMNLNRLPKVSLRTDFFRIKLKKITKNGGEKNEMGTVFLLTGEGGHQYLRRKTVGVRLRFGNERAFFVPWRCIRRIGDDIILVEVDGEEILRTDGD